MKRLKNLLSPSGTSHQKFLIYLIMIGTPATTLIAAFYLQYVIDVLPCYLCNWQRVPYAIGLIGSICIVWTRGIVQRLLAYALFLSYAAGLVLSVIHSGMEREIWNGFLSCTTNSMIDTTMDTAEILANLMETPIVPCNVIRWSFLNLTLANWNALLSSAILCFMIYFRRSFMGVRA